MELIAESYDILSKICNIQEGQLAKIFENWNEGKLSSFLIEITAQILQKMDDSDPKVPLVDQILDSADQKGTGKWTVLSALEYGMPVTLISAAVFQRFLSSQKDLRVIVSNKVGKKMIRPQHSNDLIVADLEDALYLAKILSYSQGFELLKSASITNNWNLDLGSIASIWRAGCIIRSQFLDEINSAYKQNSDLELLFLAPYFLEEIKNKEPALRRVVLLATEAKLSVPGFMAALSYLDGISSEKLPANLIQAQRDYFGAHGYQRVDHDETMSFHTKWTS
jgi:6-phosphogluconate dehydrogenase